MRHDSSHVTKFFLKSGQHCFWNLKLNGSRMMLDSKSILWKVLNQQLFLPLVLTLAHLQHHIFIRFFFWFLGHRLFNRSLNLCLFFRSYLLRSLSIHNWRISRRIKIILPLLHYLIWVRIGLKLGFVEVIWYWLLIIFFCLITISKPVVKVVSKFFQDIHMISIFIGECLFYLRIALDLKSSFLSVRIISNLHITTLHLVR